jgi:hypothetical protein
LLITLIFRHIDYFDYTDYAIIADITPFSILPFSLPFSFLLRRLSAATPDAIADSFHFLRLSDIVIS